MELVELRGGSVVTLKLAIGSSAMRVTSRPSGVEPNANVPAVTGKSLCGSGGLQRLEERHLVGEHRAGLVGGVAM